jgi:hypothetical protein
MSDHKVSYARTTFTCEQLLGRLRRRIELVAVVDPSIAAALQLILDEEAPEAREDKSRVLTEREIVLWAAERAGREYYVEAAEVLGRSRERQPALARGLAMALVQARYGWSLSKIGRVFERDHTTVLAAVRKARSGQHAGLLAMPVTDPE